MKVCVYGIALNERDHVERFMARAAEADLVLIADTGSGDGTQDALCAAGATVRPISVQPWRFDDARSASLALVPPDVDVCIALDLDEVISAGWRERLEAAWVDATRGTYFHVWSHLDDTTPGVTYIADRAHARHGYRWVNPCHEVLVPDRITERRVTLDFEVHHWPDASKERGRYLELLELGYAERPHDPRSAHYLGREYVIAGRFTDAVRVFEEHLAMPGESWADERAATLRYMGRCLDALGRPRDAIVAFREATDAAPWAREPWVDLAACAYAQQRWDLCYRSAIRALEIEDRTSSVMTSPEAWGERPYDLASVAAWRLGLHAEALRLAELAVAFKPGDERLAANVRWINEHFDGAAPITPETR